MATRGVKITGLNELENVTGNIIIPVVDPTITLATPDGQTLQSNVYQIGNYILNQAGNLFPEAKVANTVSNPAQPNITSVGTLSNLHISGSLTVDNTTNSNHVIANTITVNSIFANTITANIVTAKLANGTSNVDIANSSGNVTIGVSGVPNVATFSGAGMTIHGISNLGNIGNVKIYGGSDRSVLITDGNGNLSWTQESVAAAPNTAVQFNDEGHFAGSSTFTFNKNTDTLNVTNANLSNSLQFSSTLGGKISFDSPATANNISFIVPNSAGTNQQVLGITNQQTQELGWKTVPVYYIKVELRAGGFYYTNPNPVLRQYPVKLRAPGDYLNLNTTL